MKVTILALGILGLGGSIALCAQSTPASRAAVRQKGARPLTAIELLLKLYHGTPNSVAAAIKVRGVGFDVTPAIEAQLVEAGADKTLLALAALRRIETAPRVVVPTVRISPAAQAKKIVTKPQAVLPAGAPDTYAKVTMDVNVGSDGYVKSARVTSGSPPFSEAALTAVRGYVYRPTSLDDEVVEVSTEVAIEFAGGQASGAKN